MSHIECLPQVQASVTREGCDLNANEELEVVKAIILREEYVLRVRQLLQNHKFKFRNEQGGSHDLLALLDLLRSTTVDTVEAIQQWREVQGRPDPFVWDGANYLLKILIDLDFLDDHKVSIIRHRFFPP